MKKWIFSLLALFLLSGSVASAQQFEFETVRTPEVPGFFLVTVFADPHARPIPTYDIFVQNFDEEEARRYEPLLAILPDVGIQNLSREEFEEISLPPDTRVTALGDPIEGVERTFQVEAEDDIFAAFEIFSAQELPPIFLQDLEATFGGNISDVLVEKHYFTGEKPITIVGKFERPMKTRMELSGVTAEGEVKLSAPVPLHDETYTQSPLANDLPEIWEELAQEDTPEENTTPWWTASFWFPLGIAVVAIIVFVLLFRSLRKKYQNFQENQITEEEPLHSESGEKIETTPRPEKRDPEDALQPFESPPHLG